MSVNLGVRDKHITSSGYLAPPLALPATNIDYDSFDTNWEASALATGYYLDVAYDSGFTSYVVGYQNLDVGNVLTYPVDSLTDDTIFYYRLRAYNLTDTSFDSNTITVTTAVIYTACATYSPYFDPTPVDGLMFLTCGSLFLTSGTLGHYVIEWNSGSPAGTTVFVSGDDPLFDGDIQEPHPLDEALVLAGTLYPVIRYVYVDGIKYTAEWEVGARYSPDLLTCLDPVIVTSITCSTIYGGDSTYPNFKLSYDNENPGSYDKSRSLKYDICSGMEYLAWKFAAKIVAEQLKIYYCTSSDPIGTLVDNFIMGQQNGIGGNIVTNLYPIDYPNNPRIIGISQYTPVKFITDISSFTYIAGNYLRIEIIGSVLEPANTNTNWDIYLQTMSADDLDFTFFNTDINKINSVPSIAYDATNCWYNVTYDTLDVAIDYSNTFVYKYMQMTYSTVYNAVSNNIAVNPINNTLRWKTTGSNSWIWNGPGIYTPMNLASGESMNITRDASSITYIFTDIDDYNKFVDNISSIQADADYATYLASSDTDPEYYGYYMVYYYKANFIGDSYTTYPFYFWLGCIIDYDAINQTIKFNITVPINNYSAGSCDTTGATITTSLTSMTNTLNWTIPVGGVLTYTRETDPVSALTARAIVTNDITTTQYVFFYINEVMINNLFDFTTLGFCDNGTSQHPLYLYRSYDRLTFKAYSDHAERLANWKLERMIRLRTDNCADTAWETVYETP